MGFLAFMLIGGGSGASAWILYPGRSTNPSFPKFLMAILLGVIAAAVSSFLGQYLGFFQSGQMFEWASAIVSSCLISIFYTALVK